MVRETSSATTALRNSGWSVTPTGAVAYRRDDLLLEYPTGYGADGELVGYGDRLAVSELCWWLSRVRDPSRACPPREAARPG